MKHHRGDKRMSMFCQSSTTDADVSTVSYPDFSTERPLLPLERFVNATCPGGTHADVKVNAMSETVGVCVVVAVERKSLYRKYRLPFCAGSMLGLESV